MKVKTVISSGTGTISFLLRFRLQLYGFLKAVDCSQKQPFLFIKGLAATRKEVIKQFHLTLVSNKTHLLCH